MKILYNAIAEDTQKKLINEIKSLISDAPLIRPVMPKWNKPFKTLITNVVCGDGSQISLVTNM